jgi:POT family proton-dependent oligopeptide transporter
MFFNAFFWVAFEQAGSSLNLFTERFTDRTLSLAPWFVAFCRTRSLFIGLIIGIVGLIAAGVAVPAIISQNAVGKFGRAVGALLVFLVGIGIAAVGTLKAMGQLYWAAIPEIPTTWFQSVNPLLIIVMAPVFGGIWTFLARRDLNPSQPVKIALGLIFLGLGYIVITGGALAAKAGVPGAMLLKASMLFIVGTYFLHTIGELCLSPTGLSFVTRVAPARFVSLLMGIWFISSFIANLSGGLIAAKVEAIEKGEIVLPWKIGGQADFFLLFVISSIGAGVLVLIFTPLLKRLLHGRE